ncbi:unnamed protein product [Calypogeia fissa]
MSSIVETTQISLKHLYHPKSSGYTTRPVGYWSGKLTYVPDRIIKGTTGRLEAGDFKLYDIDSLYAKGLGIVTKAIYESDIEFAKPEAIAAAFKEYTGYEIDLSSLSIREQNVRFAALVRDVCATAGWLAGWNCLVQAAPKLGLHPRIVHDINLGAGVYGRIRRGYRKRDTIDISMEIGPKTTYDSIYCTGPKSIGGHAWKSSAEYAAVLQRPEWRDQGYSKGFSPCIAYGWIAIQIKVIPRKDSADAMRLQPLNTIDYDLDHGDDSKRGFQNGFQMGAQHSLAKGTNLQGAAFTGMISYDFQNYVRSIQNKWATEKNDGAYNMGLEDASPEEWAAIQVADSAALVPFAFESEELVNSSRAGIVAGLMQLQCHDLLFDAGCSNRITTATYSEAAGVGKTGMHTAFSIGFYDAIGKHTLDRLLKEGEGVPEYGYSACMVAGPWSPFNTRYRIFERCVKYTRQLLRSKSSEAKEILEMAHQDLVLKDCDLKIEIGQEWARALHSDASALVPRQTDKYFIPSRAHELLESPGVKHPELCTKCGPAFEALMTSRTEEEVHATPGLPEIVTRGCRAAGLAAGIRRAFIWASSDNCCDTCASRIGYWADACCYRVLSAMMYDEPQFGPLVWTLQNYFVGTVTLCPVEVPFLLSAFDLLAKLVFRDGAMGHRDILDI